MLRWRKRTAVFLSAVAVLALVLGAITYINKGNHPLPNYIVTPSVFALLFLIAAFFFDYFFPTKREIYVSKTERMVGKEWSRMRKCALRGGIVAEIAQKIRGKKIPSRVLATREEEIPLLIEIVEDCIETRITWIDSEITQLIDPGEWRLHAGNVMERSRRTRQLAAAKEDVLCFRQVTWNMRFEVHA